MLVMIVSKLAEMRVLQRTIISESFPDTFFLEAATAEAALDLLGLYKVDIVVTGQHFESLKGQRGKAPMDGAAFALRLRRDGNKAFIILASAMDTGTIDLTTFDAVCPKVDGFQRALQEACRAAKEAGPKAPR